MTAIALVLAAGIFSRLMAAYGTAAAGGISFLLMGLGDFAFTIFSFLVLMAGFKDISLGEASLIRRISGKIKTFLTEEEIYFGVKTGEFFRKIKERIVKQEKQEADKDIDLPSGPVPQERVPEESVPRELVQIHKDKVQDPARTGPEAKKHSALMSFLYIIFFAGIAVWRLGRIFTVVPLSYIDRYDYGIANSLLLLFFYCVTVIYLKMRKQSPGGRTSHGMLTLFAYVSLVYAGVIGVNSVLNIDILAVLRWVYYAASVYLTAALAFNILMAAFKNELPGDFDYIIIPAGPKAADGSTVSETGGGFFDSQEVKANFSLKSLYTIRYTLKILPGLILSLGFVLLLSTTVFVVQPHQKAVVYRLGKLERTSIAGEGLHFKLPWPIDMAEIYDTHRVASMQIGYETFFDTMNFLWDRSYDRSEYLLLLGNGNELVSVNMKIVYYISDLYSYITTSADPEAILSAAALRALMYRTVNTTLDTLLSVDRDLFSAAILEELAAFSQAESLGLSVIQVIVESIHPPADIAHVYQQVISAAIDKQTIITNARSHAQGMLIDARRQSTVTVAGAMAAQHSRVSAAQREMAVYSAAMGAYEMNPASFELSKYLDTFETTIGGNRVFVFFPGTEDSISNSLIRRQ